MKLNSIKKDLENLLAEPPIQSVLKSGDSSVRELWGLLKQLRMSEANLTRRIEELEVRFDGETLEHQLAELTSRYESRISAIQKDYDDMTEKVAKEVESVIIQANDEITKLKLKIKNLENIFEKSNASASEDSSKWLDSMALCSSLYTGSLNNWFKAMNLKSLLSEVIASICRQSNQINTSRLRTRIFKSWINSIRFLVKVKKIRKEKLFIMTTLHCLQLDHGSFEMELTSFYHKFMIVSSHYNEVTSSLLQQISANGLGDTEALERAFINHFGVSMHLSLHPCKPVKLDLSGRFAREEELREKIKEAGDLLEHSMKIIEEKDREILFLREGGFNIGQNLEAIQNQPG